ncbi:FKBP-type peptidyl-prolyl cis-trans isomerase [Sphingomonas sp. S1-29]|uniref:FKBP-type peptidyl-prolyl cis-trans isomerase n=1 Tax=Sphingomonas sp. S1-29 TaxID=2991074 RepID=UPI002240C7C9|nr:FKBP-type peptidyl-prolyl cis-trans isomerase [Sphingomonas sp. S1-29]UZK69489.1 FKBP-type peptidyl-prolyl cis-trans isomerase [Sphingomonas sp. S1-29]
MSTTAAPIRPTKRGYLIWLWVGVLVAVLVAGLLAWKGTAAVVADTGSNAQFLAYNAGQPGVEQTASGLQYRVLEAGEGDARPTDTDLVLVNYTGKLRDGETFDASQQPTPMSPTQVVPGFGEGLKLMPKDSKYRFWIKPELAYGAEPRRDPSTGQEVIPGEALLVFDVEMVDFVPEAVVRQMQQQQMMQQGAPGAAPGGAMPGGAMPGGPGGPPAPPSAGQ